MFRLQHIPTFIILFLLSCSTQKIKGGRVKDVPVEILNLNSSGNTNNKIVFLSFLVTLTDSLRDQYSFTHTNTIFAEGIIKQDLSGTDGFYEPYMLYCEILDDNKKRIEIVKIQNPIMKVFEYSPDGQTLEKKLFRSTTGELNLRFQFSKNTKFLTIYKPQADLRNLKKIYYAKISL